MYRAAGRGRLQAPSPGSFMPAQSSLFAFKFLSATHPRLRPDSLHPLGERRNEAKIFTDVLFADPSDRDDPASGDHDGRTEDGLGHENALGMVTEGAMPEVGDDHFRFIEPIMDADVVLRNTTPLLYGGAWW